MYNRSEYVTSQQLQATIKRHNFKVSKNKTTISGFAILILVFGAIGFMLAIAFFG
jgi:proteasome assembly chaperone (PAC2) family protein